MKRIRHDAQHSTYYLNFYIIILCAILGDKPSALYDYSGNINKIFTPCSCLLNTQNNYCQFFCLKHSTI